MQVDSLNYSIFRGLFRGRVDVYPRLWTSRKTGKKGNTLFLDEHFQPYDDQWTFLSSEGFDDARLGTLFLAMPVSWKGTLVQYTGRIHLLYEGKKEVRIYDYVDRNVPMLLNMFNKRR